MGNCPRLYRFTFLRNKRISCCKLLTNLNDPWYEWPIRFDPGRFFLEGKRWTEYYIVHNYVDTQEWAELSQVWNEHKRRRSRRKKVQKAESCRWTRRKGGSCWTAEVRSVFSDLPLRLLQNSRVLSTRSWSTINLLKGRLFTFYGPEITLFLFSL